VCILPARAEQLNRSVGSSIRPSLPSPLQPPLPSVGLQVNSTGATLMLQQVHAAPVRGFKLRGFGSLDGTQDLLVIYEVYLTLNPKP
jgi:hypothetical protein